MNRTNPLFQNKSGSKEHVNAATSTPIIEAGIAISPISKKPMREINCAGIKAYMDMDNRLVLPKKAL